MIRHWILIHDPSTGQRAVVSLPHDTPNPGRAFELLERNLPEGLQATLVGAESLDEVRATHPNWFEDCTFDDLLGEVLKEAVVRST